MNLDEELKALLAGLGVEMEQASEEPPSEDEEGAEHKREPGHIALFQTSKEHYGVFYRLDLVGCRPQLRVFVPTEGEPVKMEGYLIVPTAGSPLGRWFEGLAAHRGSQAFETEQQTMRQHLLFAVGEMLKRLFWAGNLEGMQFPPEIVVEQVL